MDNSNIIISVIIVLCIAAGVTAYGISEGENTVFNDLTGFSPESSSPSDNGIGDLGTDSKNGTNSGASTSGSSSSSSSGNNGGSGTSSNGGSNSGSSSSNGGSGSSSSGNSSQNREPSKISSSQAKSIASGFIGEEGAYVSNVKDDGTQYICYIANSNGTVVDAIAISYSGKNLGKI